MHFCMDRKMLVIVWDNSGALKTKHNCHPIES